MVESRWKECLEVEDGAEVQLCIAFIALELHGIVS